MSSHVHTTYLSPPSISDSDIQAVTAALRSGWAAPVGPSIAEFEDLVCSQMGFRHGVALASGTSAIHLGLKFLGVQPGDIVITSTLTFAATAFPIMYLGAIPAFVDVDESWNMDVELLDSAIRALRRSGKTISAIIPVDLYGTPANYARLSEISKRHEIPLFADSAESLGSKLNNGNLSDYVSAAAVSFNGNKIITTSGGGMLLTDDVDFVERVKHWSTQSREPAPWYEHKEVGYNYRLSNILAALGSSQTSRLPEIVRKRRSIRDAYREAFLRIGAVEVQKDPEWGISNAWLSVALFDREAHTRIPTEVRLELASNGIEARPIWKPLHSQPVFSSSPAFLSGHADDIFGRGLCLPSGTDMSTDQIARVTRHVTSVLKRMDRS